MAVKDTVWGEFDALLAETCIVVLKDVTKDPEAAAPGSYVMVSLHGGSEGTILFPTQSDETAKTDRPVDSPVITIDFGLLSQAPVGSIAVISTVSDVDDPSAWLPKSNEDGLRAISGVAG